MLRRLQILLQLMLEVLLTQLWFLTLTLTPGKHINKNQPGKMCAKNLCYPHSHTFG